MNLTTYCYHSWSLLQRLGSSLYLWLFCTLVTVPGCLGPTIIANRSNVHYIHNTAELEGKATVSPGDSTDSVEAPRSTATNSSAATTMPTNSTTTSSGTTENSINRQAQESK